MIEPICDFELFQGQRALFYYAPPNGRMIVRIVDKVTFKNDIWYVVSANKNLVNSIEDLSGDTDLESNYSDSINHNETILMVEPDELEPNYRSLELV